MRSASKTPRALLLSKHVWGDLVTLPALHEYERQKQLVNDSFELARNASALARMPGQGWLSNGLMGTLLGGNALYLLQKTLDSVSSLNWAADVFDDDGSPPNWVQDRPSARRRLLDFVGWYPQPDARPSGHPIVELGQGAVTGLCVAAGLLRAFRYCRIPRVERYA